jgi:type VI secretion system protein ImpL
VKVLTLFKSRWFVTILGLTLLSLLIWFGGPWLGIGESQPLASPVARLVTIIVILGVWLGWLLFMQSRERAKATKMAGELAGQDARPTGNDRDDRTAAERSALAARFTEAVDTLRRTRKGGRNLYQLPWYIVIGPPGSGKSTLLQNSGLNFRLSNKFGKDALRGIGGTRNCDWWFTDEAVFLDTAGRYTTQDSDRVADGSAWEEFLKLLRKYRKRRPINGVIVTVSLSDLLTLDEAGRQEHVLAIRSRLEELARHLRIGVPAYLVFTKCDLIAGFTEYFDDLNPDLRAQVFGMSFPVETTLDGTAAKLFAEEFALLLERVNTRSLDRLHAERDRSRRAAILSFPLQLSSVRELARGFVEGVFSGHGYSAPLLLRGAYLTSGTQEGTPIDRMMGAVARTFGVDAARVQAPGARSRTFFVERLLRDVLFRESGFAGTDPKLERQKILLQVASYVGVLAVTALMIFGFATSYSRNSSYLADVQTALDTYSSESSLALAPNAAAYFSLVLTRLEALSSTVDAADRHRGDVPLSMRFGLYQGRSIGRETRDAYFRESNGILAPAVALQVRKGLQANAAEPQALYYYLKAYLMLGEPERAKADELLALTDIEWRKLFPGDAVVPDVAHKHVAALLGEALLLRPQTLDQAAVEQARSTLRTAELPILIYGSLKLEQGGDALPLKLDKELGLLGSVFRRASGVPLSEPISGLYTQPAFKALAEGGIEEAVKRFAEDDWVFGATKVDDIQRARHSRDVLGLYETDYIAAWDGVLNDIRLQPASSIQDASALAAKLSGPNSPLKLFLKVVRDNTADLLREPPGDAGDQALDAAEKLAKKRAAQSALAKALASSGGAQAAAAKPGDAIAAHFEELNKLTAGPAGAAPIDQTIQVLDQLGKTLLTMTDFSSVAGQPNPALLQATQAASQLPPPVAGWVASLTGKSEALVGGGAKEALDDQFQQMVARDCAEFTGNRYPFVPTSATDIPVQNFGELFGTGGRFDSYYKASLEKLVDASGANWKWKTGPGAIKGSDAVLRAVQAADRIRQMYFRGGPVPDVGFTILTPVLDPAIARLVIEVDGQRYEYSPGGPANAQMKWPGPQPGRASVAGYGADGTLLAKFEFQNDWAFFRILQAGRLVRETEVRYVATWDFGGRQARVAIQATNLKNPFLKPELQSFRCGG